MSDRPTGARETEHALRNELWGLKLLSARAASEGQSVSTPLQVRIEQLERALADLLTGRRSA